MDVGRRAVIRGGAMAWAAANVPWAMAQATSRGSGLLTIGTVSMRTLNPAIQPGNATGLPGSQLFAGLVELDAQFKPVPYLARSWEVSPDGRVYTFQLVEGATFHDGRPITARDVVFSIETVKASHPLMSVAYGQVIEKVAATGPSTVQIMLTRPFGGMFGALSPLLTPILPEHVYGAAAGPIQQNPANARPVGSGPYKFVQWKTGDFVRMERDPSHFRKGRAGFDELVFKINEDSLAKTLGLEKGEIDFLPFSFLRVNELVRLKANPSLTVTTDGYGALGPINYLEFNLRDPLLSDLRVRKAIARSIDKDFITRTLHKGMSKRLDGPLHSGNPMFDAGALTLHPYDMQAANALLDAAGFPRKADGIRMRLTLDLPTFEPDSSQLVGEYIRAQLRRNGIEVTLRRSTDLADWSSRIGQWNYQLSMNSTWNYSDPIIGVNRSFLSTNIRKQTWANTQGYANPKVDDLLLRAAAEVDPAKRRALYREFQTIVTEELPFVWTNEGIYVTVYNKKLAGVPQGAFGTLTPLDTMRLG